MPFLKIKMKNKSSSIQDETLKILKEFSLNHRSRLEELRVIATKLLSDDRFDLLFVIIVNEILTMEEKTVSEQIANDKIHQFIIQSTGFTPRGGSSHFKKFKKEDGYYNKIIKILNLPYMAESTKGNSILNDLEMGCINFVFISYLLSHKMFIYSIQVWTNLFHENFSSSISPDMLAQKIINDDRLIFETRLLYPKKQYTPIMRILKYSEIPEESKEGCLNHTTKPNIINNIVNNYLIHPNIEIIFDEIMLQITFIRDNIFHRIMKKHIPNAESISSNNERLKQDITNEAKNYLNLILDINDKKIQTNSVDSPAPRSIFDDPIFSASRPRSNSFVGINTQFQLYNTYILGDADGSVGRMMLIAIQSGHVKLSINGLKKLAELLQAEYEVLNAIKNKVSKVSYKNFQESDTNAFLTSSIVKLAVYKPSDSNLIFLGDIIHDRLSCNKSATISLVKKLHSAGAIFIKGNHDSFQQFNELGSDVFGANAKNTGFGHDYGSCKKKWQDFEKEFFAHCYYDERNKLFYIHNGVKWIEGTQNYITAFGKFSAHDVKNLAHKINKDGTEYNGKDYYPSPEHVEAFGSAFFTEFSPKDKDPLGPIFNDHTLIHGHHNDYSTKELPKLLNLNSRCTFDDGSSGFLAAAQRIETKLL